MAISLSQTSGFRSSGVTIQIPYASQNSGGALLTLAISGGGASTAVASAVTDSAGNAWSLAADCQSGAVAGAQIWYAPNCIGSTNTVTVTNTRSQQNVQIEISEWSGCSTAQVVLSASSHAVTAASTHGATPVSVDASTTLFLFQLGFNGSFDITSTAAGYTALNSTFNNMRTFYRIVSGSTTTQSPEMISSGTPTSANVLVAFAGGAVATPTVLLRRRSMTVLGVS